MYDVVGLPLLILWLLLLFGFTAICYYTVFSIDVIAFCRRDLSDGERRLGRWKGGDRKGGIESWLVYLLTSKWSRVHRLTQELIFWGR